jgi:hypothetical protein
MVDNIYKQLSTSRNRRYETVSTEQSRGLRASQRKNTQPIEARRVAARKMGFTMARKAVATFILEANRAGQTF